MVSPVDTPYLIGYNTSESAETMTREFVMLPEFDKRWRELGLTDKELKTLQEELTVNPHKGDLVQGTGGLRKIRIAFEGKGKSGSAGVCYVDFAVFKRIYLITAYSKNEKDNLSNTEKNEIKKLIKLLEHTLNRS